MEHKLIRGKLPKYQKKVLKKLIHPYSSIRFILDKLNNDGHLKTLKDLFEIILLNEMNYSVRALVKQRDKLKK